MLNLKNLRVGVDIRFLDKNKISGIEEYTINLLKTLISSKPNWHFILFYNLWGKEMPDFGWLKSKNVEIKTINFPSKILNLLFVIFNWPKIDKWIGKIDVFFMPTFSLISLPTNTPLVLTIHDLSFLYFPRFFNFKSKIWHKLIRLKFLLKRASKIIAVSNSTKNDILKFFPEIDSSKISVIHLGVSEEFKILDKDNPKLQKVRQKYNLPEKFILYLGVIEPRKNIESIIKAFNLLKRNLNDQNLKLVIAGRLGWKYKKVLYLLKNSHYKDDIILINNFRPEERVYFYNLAKVFVYPSFFEGFGLPILEAMACGLPVICSNTSSMPEVIGSSGILIDPYNINDLILAQKQLLLDRGFKEYLVSKGLERVKNFSWQKCGQKVSKVFEEII